MRVLVVIDVEKKCHLFDADSPDIKRQFLNAMREFCEVDSKCDKKISKLSKNDTFTIEQIVSALIEYQELPVFGDGCGVYVAEVQKTGLISEIFS